jgi:hypothetical protein
MSEPNVRPCEQAIDSKGVMAMTGRAKHEPDALCGGARKSRLMRALGPGLSDDDPSGMATYSHTGAQFSYAISWTLLLTYPLMCAIQEIGARIGRTTGHGIAAISMVAGFQNILAGPVLRNIPKSTRALMRSRSSPLARRTRASIPSYPRRFRYDRLNHQAAGSATVFGGVQRSFVRKWLRRRPPAWKAGDIERLHEELAAIKTVLPLAETAAMLFWPPCAKSTPGKPQQKALRSGD